MIWGGHGIWVFPIILACVLCLGPAAVLAWNNSIGQPATVEFAPAVSTGFFFAALLCYLLGKRVNRKTGRRVIDRITGRLKLETAYHHCFFVKVEYWGFLCLLLAAVMCVESFY
jgi:hypothetical protein